MVIWVGFGMGIWKTFMEFNFQYKSSLLQIKLNPSKMWVFFVFVSHLQYFQELLSLSRGIWNVSFHCLHCLDHTWQIHSWSRSILLGEWDKLNTAALTWSLHLGTPTMADPTWTFLLPSTHHYSFWGTKALASSHVFLCAWLKITRRAVERVGLRGC